VWDRQALIPSGLRAGRYDGALLLLRHADGKAVLGNRAFQQSIDHHDHRVDSSTDNARVHRD
jgi:hypothetical protein